MTELADSATPVRDAATVALLRDGVDGIETWLLTRVAQMVFAAGMSVFPGGRVEPADADLPMGNGDFPTLATRFGCDERVARALVGAAVRETFEETGVLLTVPAPTADLRNARADVESGRLAFADLLREHRLAIDAAALHPWARWVTPPGEARRYDTRFFVRALPADAAAANVTSESSAAGWLGVAATLDLAQRGERKLMWPTRATLTELSQFATVEDVLAAAADRSLEPFRPTPEQVANEQ